MYFHTIKLVLTIKKLFIAFAFTSAMFSCEKETSTPNTSGNNNTDTTKTSNKTIGKPGPNITDSENNTYKTVFIGTQQWMGENLKVSIMTGQLFQTLRTMFNGGN